MTGYSAPAIWAIILATALGTYLLRWSFLGGMGSRAMPEWLLRMLRYTAVAVLPGLVAPGVAWPEITGGQPDASRLGAALAAAVVAVAARNILAGFGAGMAAFWGIGWWLG